MIISKQSISKFLILIMIFSVTIIPHSSSVNNAEEENTIIDYSLMDRIGLNQNHFFTEGRAGTLSTLVIVAQFSDDPSSRWTNAEVEDLIFDDMSDFFDEASYGAIQVDGDAVGPVVLPGNMNSYQYTHDSWGTLYKFRDSDGNGEGVINDALNAAAVLDPDIDFDEYDYLLVLVNGDWWRGLGGGCGQGCYTYTDEVTFPDGTTTEVEFAGISLVGENDAENEIDVWGRIAHEFGHQIGLSHVSVNYNNPFDLMASLYPGHPSTYTKQGQPGFRNQEDWMNLDSNRVLTVEQSAQTYTLQALEINAGPTQALKIPLNGDRYLMVEGRMQILSDALGMPDQGVLIYFVDPNDNKESEGKLPIQVIDATPPTVDVDGNLVSAGLDDALFSEGQSLRLQADVPNPSSGEDTATVTLQESSGKEVFIRVDNIDVNTGTFTVYVEYEIAGLEPPDLSINDWDPTPWASVDIWIDSELNGWDYYTEHISGDTSVPDVGNGDTPWANNMNRLYARITNNGEYTAENTRIEYYYNDPMGIGDDGDWELIGQVVQDIPAGSTIEPFIEWTPIIPGLDPWSITDFHSCVKVVIIPHENEIITGNNEAQENIARFETRSSSPFHEVVNEFEVANPFNYTTQVMLEVSADNPGWDASLGWYSMILQPNEVLTNNYTITPPSGTFVGVSNTIHLSGWYVYNLYNHSHLIPIGGISVEVSPVEKIDINLGINTPILSDGILTFSGEISGQGLIRNPVYEAPVALLITSPTDNRHVVHVDLESFSGPHASFAGSVDIWSLEQRAGSWTIQAIYAGDNHHEMGNSEPISFDIEDLGIIPNIHENITVDSVFVLEGNLPTGTYENSNLEVTYSSPSGNEYQHSLNIRDRSNSYSDRIVLDEEGVWRIDISYVNQDRRVVEWQEEVNVRPKPIIDQENMIIDIPERGEIINGSNVNLSGRFSQDIRSTDSLSIVITSPTGISYSRQATIAENRSFVDEMIFNEEGRWTVDYVLTREDGDTITFSEPIDVNLEEIEEDEEEEDSTIPGFSLIIASLGILLACYIRNENEK